MSEENTNNTNFTYQQLFCCICGKDFLAGCNAFAKGTGVLNEAVCSLMCLKEKDWRRTLSLAGKAYYPLQETANIETISPTKRKEAKEKKPKKGS